MLSVEDDNDDVDDPAAADNECDNCVTISIANTPIPIPHLQSQSWKGYLALTAL